VLLQVIRKTPEEMQPGGSHQHEAQLLAVAADPSKWCRRRQQLSLSQTCHIQSVSTNLVVVLPSYPAKSQLEFTVLYMHTNCLHYPAIYSASASLTHHLQPRPDDLELKGWVKLPGQLLPHSSADMQLTGWRDPFITSPHPQNSYVLLTLPFHLPF
jgi:hypothetical protein